MLKCEAVLGVLLGVLGANAASAAMPTVTIAPGVRMPLVGLGTGGYWAGNSSAVYAGARQALALGYRHFDTALGYETQPALGRAIRESGIPRQQLFITSKIPGGLNSSEATEAVQQCLAELGTSYLDLLLIHYPATWSGQGGPTSRLSTWRVLELAVDRGAARAIGVSHFCPRHLAAILEVARRPVALNQVEYHVGMAHSGLNKTDGKRYDAGHNITYQSFMPLCGQCHDSALVDGELTRGIGKKYGKTGAQVSLRWLVQRGVPLIPRSGSKEHQRQNIELFDFELSRSDMAQLDAVNDPKLGGQGGDCNVP